MVYRNTNIIRKDGGIDVAKSIGYVMLNKQKIIVSKIWHADQNLIEVSMTDNNNNGLHFNCDRCDKPINQPAALLFSPPLDDNFNVKKHHVCIECYKQMVKEFHK